MPRVVEYEAIAGWPGHTCKSTSCRGAIATRWREPHHIATLPRVSSFQLLTSNVGMIKGEMSDLCASFCKHARSPQAFCCIDCYQNLAKPLATLPLGGLVYPQPGKARTYLWWSVLLSTWSSGASS